jgi:hypothetical protein
MELVGEPGWKRLAAELDSKAVELDWTTTTPAVEVVLSDSRKLERMSQPAKS